MSTWEPTASLATLQKRAYIFAKIRRFFEAHAVLEVDTPLLADFPNIDDNISPISLSVSRSSTQYLVTSPEYYMKRFLTAYRCSCYQFCSCFRQDEKGSLHNTEFTMLEYYRVNYTHWALMKEVDLLLQLVLSTAPCSWLSYNQAFQNIGINIANLEGKERKQALISFLKAKEDITLLPFDKVQEWEEYIFSFYVQPQLGKTAPEFVFYYPFTQAALASQHKQDTSLAYRFEIFYKAIELGNGYQELQDSKEQTRRMHSWNQARQKQNKPALPLDPKLDAAMQQGLPFCSGIAIGMDRLVMLATKQETLADVQTFYAN